MERQDVALLEERLFAARGRIAIGPRSLQRGLARPYQHLHAERFAVTGNDASDTSVAVDSECLTAQSMADADLPSPRLERSHLPRDLPRSGKDQTPRKLRGGIGWRARM